MIHSFVGNWGFSIIITFIVRGIMYPLTKAHRHSTARCDAAAEDSGDA